jgi:hypothetical protein
MSAVAPLLGPKRMLSTVTRGPLLQCFHLSVDFQIGAIIKAARNPSGLGIGAGTVAAEKFSRQRPFRPPASPGLRPSAQKDIASAEAFCHCSATFAQNLNGFIDSMLEPAVLC